MHACFLMCGWPGFPASMVGHGHARRRRVAHGLSLRHTRTQRAVRARALALARAMLAAAAKLVALAVLAVSASGSGACARASEGGSCAAYSDCKACTSASKGGPCAWQPPTGCQPGCVVMDVSCYEKVSLCACTPCRHHRAQTSRPPLARTRVTHTYAYARHARSYALVPEHCP